LIDVQEWIPGDDPVLALLPAEEIEQRRVDLLVDEVLHHLGLDVTLVDEDLAQATPGLLLLLDLLETQGLPQLLLRDDP